MAEPANLSGRRVLVGVCGGIAAYKTAHLVRLLRRSGAEVRVVMTRSACDFISPLTMATLSQWPVLTEGFDPTDGRWNSHVSLAEWCDYFVIAPATANTLAKMAAGIGDNLLLTTYLSARGLVLVAPAMDLGMYSHAATRSNLSLLRDRGVRVVEPGEGFLASGLEGKGRMAEPEEILTSLVALSDEMSAKEGALSGRRVLLTMGPTREPIDPVRYITNRSSGLMGRELADALLSLGAEVHCVAGPSRCMPSGHARLHVREVETAAEMREVCASLWDAMDAGVLAAAVSDYTPRCARPDKLKREGTGLVLELVSTVDIAAELGGRKREDQRLVGFALETRDGMSNARGKLERKRLDLCVLNAPREGVSGFECETNEATLLFRDGRVAHRGVESKRDLARAIARELAGLW